MTGMKHHCLYLQSLIAISLAGGLLTAAPAKAQTWLRDICRVKGQEENTLQGLGLVVGVDGTGDNDVPPTARALATMMKLMGHPIGQGPKHEDLLKELSKARNVALVFVSATVPAAGARQGDRLDCRVSALSAKSLEGGQLVPTPLLGPRPGSERVYAFAQGLIHVESASQLATGKVYRGCRLEEDFHNVFTEDGKITLVLDENHVGFQVAQDVADQINNFQMYLSDTDSPEQYIAKALDQVNIDVRVPLHYQDDPVSFVSQILNQKIANLQTESRVVVNRRTGLIVIGADVEIGPVVLSKKGIVVEAGGETTQSPFVPFDPAKKAEPAKLKDLVDALNAIKASPEDKIDILEGVQRNGKLYGRLIIE